MKNLKTLSVLFAGIALTFLACSKGDTGPAGPAGPPGPDSVIHSKWIILNMNIDAVTFAPDTAFVQTVSAPALTQKILDSGIVLTYLGFIDNTGTTVVNADSYFAYQFYSPGAIDLISGIDWTGISFRYVIVPGSVTAGTISSGPAKGLTLAELKKMSYSTVEKLLGSSGGKVTTQ